MFLWIEFFPINPLFTYDYMLLSISNRYAHSVVWWNQSGLESNANEGVFHTSQRSRTRASPSDAV